jgi:hypothetical protein
VRQRVFGGYKWRNDLAVEAAFARSESYALRPFGVGAPGGVGLTLASPQDTAALGVERRRRRQLHVPARVRAVRPRRLCAGSRAGATANLLIGRRAPLARRHELRPGHALRRHRALGLNLEYTRFGRFAFETFGSTLPENDQVRLGVQLRF